MHPEELVGKKEPFRIGDVLYVPGIPRMSLTNTESYQPDPSPVSVLSPMNRRDHSQPHGMDLQVSRSASNSSVFPADFVGRWRDEDPKEHAGAVMHNMTVAEAMYEFSPGRSGAASHAKED